jgi:hypothetical protein
MVAALVICLLITAGLDVVAGRTLAAGEAIYALEVAGLSLLWRLATPIGGRRHPLPHCGGELSGRGRPLPERPHPGVPAFGSWRLSWPCWTGITSRPA